MTGKELKKLRIKAGITQRRLADALGFDNSLICRFESGERRISDGRAEKLSRAIARLRLAREYTERVWQQAVSDITSCVSL